VAASSINPHDRLTAFDRLEIYNRQYWLRVLECFYDDYPGLRAVLGEQPFRDLATAYLANHPSTRFTLRELGRHVVDFIAAEPRWTGTRQELARDMARLEWAHIEAFDNEAKTPLALADLQGREAAQIHLRLQPHITVLQLAYPLDDYLLALRENTRLRGEASNAVQDLPALSRTRVPKLPARRVTRLVVHRHRNVVYYKRLQAGQYDLLIALQKGASLQGALQALPIMGKAPPIQEWFANWSALGWFWLRA
jgi:hypothetical protein